MSRSEPVRINLAAPYRGAQLAVRAVRARRRSAVAPFVLGFAVGVATVVALLWAVSDLPR